MKIRKNSLTVLKSGFLVKYNIAESDIKPFCINSFQTLGWPDPFPFDCANLDSSKPDGHNLIIPKNEEDLVY